MKYKMDLRKKEDKRKVLNAMTKHFDRIAVKKNNFISLIDIWNVEDFIQKKFKLSNLQVSLMTDHIFKLKLLTTKGA
jgi:predicted RNA binding protein with dsRBD fold (UPF0201 family)